MDKATESGIGYYVESSVFILNKAYTLFIESGMSKEVAVQFCEMILKMTINIALESEKQKASPDMATLMAKLSPGGTA